MPTRALAWVGRLGVRRPAAVLVGATILTALALAALPRLEVTASRFALIAPHDDAERARVQAFADAFGRRADLVAAIRGEPDSARAASDALAARLGELEESAGVVHRVELPPQAALLSLSLSDLEALTALPPGPAPRVVDIVEQARRALAGETGQTLDTLDDAPVAGEAALRLLTRLLRELEAWLADPSHELRLVDSPRAALDVDDGGYFVSRDGETRYVFLSPREATDRYAYVAPLTRRARAIGEEVAAEHGVTIAFTGYPAIAADEVEAIRNGSLVTGLVAALLVVALFAIGFRGRGAVVVAGAPLGLGIAWAFGAIAVTLGELNLLTQVAAPVFAGLGIDFSIHLLAAYQRARQGGDAHGAAVDAAMTGAGRAIVTGGVTTAAAFGALAWAEYDALAQLGLVASLGLLLVMAAVLTITPALLTLGERRGWTWLRVGGAERPPPAVARRWIERLAWIATARPRATLGVAGAITVALVFASDGVAFDPDVEALMPRDAESIVAARAMVAGSGFSNEHLGARARDEDELRELTARLAALPAVGRVESAALLSVEDEELKLSLLREARRRPPRAAPSADASLEVALGGLASQARGAADEVRSTSAAAAAPLRELARAADAACVGLEGATPARVRAFDEALADGAGRWREALAEEPRAARPSDLPAPLRRRLVAADGSYAVYAYPRGDTFENLDEFNRQVRSVAPDAVGYPVQFAAFLARMKASASRVAALAVALVLLILWLDFRRLRDALLALSPVALGVGWLYLLMGALGLDANLANAAAVPLIIGIGVDDGVHLIHRVREEGAPRPALTRIFSALTLTTFTTVAGFGTIGLAPHRGMQSFALVMILGAVGCLLATLFVLPALLSLLQGRSDKSSTRPTTGAH